ncbi:hypothetical protein PCASD_18110 [Puccinia coronata f. sp. avenae]|uniref:DH domain-containing protein n=2 Tax=Puccinia coronata f. sp. avenae TaxID=200324 RepID=A0A2N5SSM4_9BASI|nr:hypothetical protein PCASD_18110 [Puccinia coronata f. sp. avenae]
MAIPQPPPLSQSHPVSPSTSAHPAPDKSASPASPASLEPNPAPQQQPLSHHLSSSASCSHRPSSPSTSASNSPLLSPSRLLSSMSLAPFTPGASSKVPPSASSPTSGNPPFRSLRPRRSAASLRSIPEHRSKEDQPPLPIPATPWVEPATPGFLNTIGEPHSSCSSSPASIDPPSFNSHPSQYSPLDPAHLQAQPSSPYQTRPDEHFAIGPHTVPGPRDQRSLSRYRLGSQPLSSRHSEGSQYASSSNWTPSSTNGSRIGLDSTVNGMRSSVASRDSRFTAETDYDDYCHSKPILLQQSHQNVAGSHSQPLNLSVSASWHSGDQPSPKFPGTCPTPQSKPGQNKTGPTLLSLINLDQNARSQRDMVGLGITSDQTISVTRGSRSPSLTGSIEPPRPVVPNHPAPPKLNRMARSASSSVSNGTGHNPSPFNPIYSQHQNALNLNLRPNRAPTPLGERSTPPKALNSDSGDALNTRPGNLYIPPNSFGQSGLPYDTSTPSNSNSGSNTPSNAYTASMAGSIRRTPSSNTPELVADQREHFTPKGHVAEGSSESKHRFYQNQAHWDDFDDQSPVLHSSSQVPSQAVTLVEDGRGCIVDVSNSKCSLDKLVVPEDTTHLLLAKTFSPFLVGALLASKLPTISGTLVVLDISDAGLTSLPSAIACCEVLEELNVSGNVMANGELPVFLSNLTALKVLAADRCGLYQIAYSYGGLTQLRDLSVRYNHIRSLPSWLCLLPRLEILLVDANEFEPPWQELVEPLLSSNVYAARAEPQTTSVAMSDPTTDLRCLASTHTSPVPSSVGSTLRSLPESSSHNSRPSPDEHQRTNAERTKRGRRHLAGSESTWVTSASSLVSDHLGEDDERPQSACSAEDSNNLNSPRSNYLRRLRSTNDMRAAPNARPLSAHETTVHSIASLMDPNTLNGSRDDGTDGFRPPLPANYPPRPASSAVTPLSPLEYADESHHYARNDSKAPPPSEISQSGSNMTSQLSREYQKEFQKKSFGFLKKMSLGKLRREPARSRTASTASNSLYVRSSGYPASEALDPSKLMSPDDFTPQESDEYRQTDRSSKSSVDETQTSSKLADSRSTPSNVKKRLDNRRSFLRLEDHFLPQKSPPVKLPGPIPEHDTLNKPESPLTEAVESTPATGNSTEPIETTEPISAHPQPASSVNVRWASLRSIMMYLRDVHDLSGDVTRAHSGATSGGARPIPSNGISRTTSTKQSQPPTNMFSDGKSTPVPYTHSAVEFDLETLDNSLSNGILPGGPNVPPTSEPVKVTENALRRFKVIEEIVATEKSYIKGLKELHDIYITSASLTVSSSIGKEKEPMVPPAERKVVFNNVEAIIGFHVDVLLPDFQEVMDRLRQKQAAIAMADLKEPTSGDEQLPRRRQELESQLTNFAAEELARVFIRHAAFLKLYSTYITQFDTALERLREWSTTAPAPSPNVPAWTPSSSSASNTPVANHHSTLSGGQKKRLKTYMKRCRAHSSHTQMNLESYLLMPVQRLPRYKLLLENLVSCTPDLNCMSTQENESKNQSGAVKDKKSAPPLVPNRVAVEALNIVSAVTAEMNERKRDSEGRQRLLYWQQRFGNKFRSPLVQPHRTLLKEGTMNLMRTVKLTTKDAVPTGGGPSHPTPRIRVPVLNTDSQPVPMIVLLCTDLLVLVKDPGDGGRGSNQTPASLFQALRLAQHSRPHMNLPATIFGADKTMIRFVDNRAIFYFQCDCQRSAAAWMVAINQQVPLL